MDIQKTIVNFIVDVVGVLGNVWLAGMI